jgi:uncharacterized membrane protein
MVVLAVGIITRDDTITSGVGVIVGILLLWQVLADPRPRR